HVFYPVGFLQKQESFLFLFTFCNHLMIHAHNSSSRTIKQENWSDLLCLTINKPSVPYVCPNAVVVELDCNCLTLQILYRTKSSRHVLNSSKNMNLLLNLLSNNAELNKKERD